jgi:VCBS repeat protein
MSRRDCHCVSENRWSANQASKRCDEDPSQTPWEIKGSGDFNGDGKSDIVWQSSDGTPAIWLMDGTNVLSTSAAGSFNPGSDWDLIV